MLTRDYYDFARQAGCTHVVVHLVDYFNRGTTNPRDNQPTGSKYEPWGVAGDPEKLWTIAELKQLRREIEDAGLVFAAIENLDPAHWHDILLDGPRYEEQLEKVKTIIRRMGEAGIPVLGYNFSLAGVCGRVTTASGRGRALTLEMDGPAEDEPVPKGVVWNMVYDEAAPPGVLPRVSNEQLWDRLRRFLEEVVPVAEQSGVRLAAHPDDPPMPTMRGQARLVYQPDMYQRLLDIAPSRSNALEFCVGTVAEMTEGDVHEAVDRYSVDMVRILTILERNAFDGVIIPDHTPQMSCAAPWHAGMAHTLGFILAAKAVLKSSSSGLLMEKSVPRGGSH
jgi:mannonate dehydratase